MSQLAKDGILIGLVIAGVGFLFVLIYTTSELFWGSFLGANPRFGRSLSFGVMTFGVAVATLVWLIRELVVVTRKGIQRTRFAR